MNKSHIIVLLGGGYAEYSTHEGEPVARWLRDCGVSASVFHYPLNQRHPVPLIALQDEIRERSSGGTTRIGLIGFSAGGHLAGLAALAPSTEKPDKPAFAILGYAITSMETETYRPSRLILLGSDAPRELRRATSLDALVKPGAPPRFLWHTAEDTYVTLIDSRHRWPETASHTRCTCSRTVRTASALPKEGGEAERWTGMAWRWLGEYI